MTHVEPESACVYDSSAFFIRDEESGREILVFGDVEPDSISLIPRTARVWADAARKIVAGTLSAIFIECSYDDSQPDETLFGHLAPRHLIAELQVLADKVGSVRRGSSASSEVDMVTSAEAAHVCHEADGKKRKRLSNGLGLHEEGRRGRVPWRTVDGAKEGERYPQTPESPAVAPPAGHGDLDGEGVGSQVGRVGRGDENGSGNGKVHFEENGIPDPTMPLPLKDVKVVIIHVKDPLRDGPPAGETILAQLLEREREVGLGCVFEVSRTGGEVWV